MTTLLKTKTTEIEANKAYVAVLRVAAQIAENAYRRGFQHGNAAAVYGITADDCEKYRHYRFSLPILPPEPLPVNGVFKINWKHAAAKDLVELHCSDELIGEIKRYGEKIEMLTRKTAVNEYKLEQIQKRKQKELLKNAKGSA